MQIKHAVIPCLLVVLSIAASACEYDEDMTLPISREETATPASPVRSSTINAIQDAIVGGKVAPHWRWQAFARAGSESSIAFDHGGTYKGGIRATGADANYSGGLVAPIPEGYSITGLRTNIKGTGAAQEVVVFLSYWTTAGSVLIANIVATNPSGAAFTEYTADKSATPVLLPPGAILTVGATMGLSGTQILGFAVRVERL